MPDGTVLENTTTQNHHNTKGPCQKHTTNNKLYLKRLTIYVIFPEAHEKASLLGGLKDPTTSNFE